MGRRLLLRGPEDALIDCWIMGDNTSAVIAAIPAAAHTLEVAVAPTARVADLTVAADYVRWVDSEPGLEDTGATTPSDFERVLTA